MTTPAHPFDLEKATAPKVIAVKISRKLIAQLDRAAGNNWDTRNRVVQEVLEQYFTGQLVRADDTPPDFSDSIDFNAPIVRRELPHVET